MGFLIGSPLGYVAGLWASSNIVLPVLWAWPKARRLDRERRLIRPIPVALFLVAPAFWTLLVLASVLAVSAAFPAAWEGYLLGLAAGFGQIARLVWNPNADMEADFADTFHGYLRASRVERQVYRS